MRIGTRVRCRLTRPLPERGHGPEQCVHAPCADMRETGLGGGGAQLPCPSLAPRAGVLASPRASLASDKRRKSTGGPPPVE